MRYDFYRYQVGNVMQTARHSPWADIVWRGRLTVLGRDGKPYEVPVYRLRGAYLGTVQLSLGQQNIQVTRRYAKTREGTRASQTLSAFERLAASHTPPESV